MRTCPRCSFLLTPAHYRETELDHCGRCDGTWFDPGDAGVPLEAGESGGLEGSGNARPLGKSRLDCPDGHGALFAWRVALDDQNVVVAACPRCRGCWLDRGEGKRLARRVRTEPLGRVPAGAGPPGLSRYLFQLVTGFPVEVWNPVRRPPVIVYGLLVVLPLVFMWQHLAPEETLLWALVPEFVARGERLWTLLSHAFLHASLPHLVGNLYFLWVFGDNVEDLLGKSRFVIMFVLCTFAGALAQVASDPASPLPSLGASGAISGLMGAYLVLFPHVKVWVVALFIPLQLSIVAYLGLWVLLQVVHAATSSALVAWYAHLGGFAAGALLGFMFKRTLRDQLSERPLTR